MAQSPDHPELVFLEALQTNGSPMFTVGRRGKRPRWIVMHTMQAHETGTTAEGTANYFHTGAGGRTVSAHYCADDNSIVQCVLLRDAAWTVGNSEGNDEGINWELAGFAEQTREQWLDPFSKAMLARVAPYVVSDAARYGIPLHHCTLDDLGNRRPGLTTHADMAVVFGGSDHWDPGPNFPWDHFMQLLGGGDMTPEEHNDVKTISWRTYAIRANRPVVEGGDDAGQPNEVYNQFAAIRAGIDAILARLDALESGGVPGGGATPDEVRAIVDAELDEAFRGGADQDG